MSLESTIAAGLSTQTGRRGVASLRVQLITGVIGSMGLKGLNALLMLGVAIMLARVLGPEGYGVYAFALSVVGLLSLPATMGLPTLLVREVAKYHLQEDWARLNGILRRANQAALLLSVLLALLTGLLMALFGSRHEVIRGGAIAWALVLVPLTALGDLRGAALRGLRHVVQGEIPAMVIRPGLLLLVTACGISFWTLTPTRAIGVNVGAAAAAFVIGAILMWRAMPGPVRAADPAYETGAWARSVLPLSLIAGLQAIQGHTATVMVGLLNTSADVGTYRVTAQVAGLAAFTLVAINAAIAPHIVRLYHASQIIRLERLVRWSARLILVVALPIALTFVLFGRQILSGFFGEAYGAGHVALAILSIGHVVGAAMGPLALLLKMTGRERTALAAMGAGAAVNVLLNLILIPRFGIEGAAAAGLMSVILSMAILYRQAAKQLRIRPGPF